MASKTARFAGMIFKRSNDKTKNILFYVVYRTGCFALCFGMLLYFVVKVNADAVDFHAVLCAD